MNTRPHLFQSVLRTPLHSTCIRWTDREASDKKSFQTDIAFYFYNTRYGEVLMASTGLGLCWLAFIGNREEAVKELAAQYPLASFVQAKGHGQEEALMLINEDKVLSTPIVVHVGATDFQLEVWQHLLQIPSGCTLNYGDLALALGKPGAARAVGTAVGSNPLAYVIPCHRVVRNNGAPGGYRWGLDLKRKILDFELNAQPE